jgi:NADPH2:quinone reductase
MKTIVYRDNGDPGVLELVERDRPAPGPGEVRVRVAVSGVNPTDVQARSGVGHAKNFPEITPHHDGAGTIDAVGDGVDPGRVGRRVWLFMAAAGRPAGTAAEYTVVPAERAVPLPDETGFDVGAALGVPALAAHRALTVIEDGPRRLAPGSPEKARLATAAGAHHVVDYREGDPVAEIRAIAPDGVDVIAEVALGANLDLDLSVLRFRGTLSVYANNGGVPVELDVRRTMVMNTRFQFLVLYTAGPQVLGAAIEDVTAAVADGALPVGEDHGLPLLRFPLDRTADAHRAVENGAVGKVLVDLS